MDVQPDPDFFWYFLSSDQEVSEQLAITLVEDIIKRSQDVIFEKHIESQVLPYAVRFSQDVMERVIRWEFFKHDPGIQGDLSSWQPEQGKNRLYSAIFLNCQNPILL
jgi:hypothetical protein